MHPFDEKFLARREKQIEDLYVTRAMAGALTFVGVVLGGIAVPFLIQGGAPGVILLVSALLFGVGGIVMAAAYVGEKSAARAVLEDRAALLELYAAALEKPKRGDEPASVRVGDDGEIPLDDALAAQMRERAQS